MVAMTTRATQEDLSALLRHTPGSRVVDCHHSPGGRILLSAAPPGQRLPAPGERQRGRQQR